MWSRTSFSIRLSTIFENGERPRRPRCTQGRHLRQQRHSQQTSLLHRKLPQQSLKPTKGLHPRSGCWRPLREYWSISTLPGSKPSTMGSTHKLDRTLSCALMAEFVRIQLVMGKDLTKSLIALHLELENTSQAFLSDISRVLNLQPTDPVAYEVKAHLHRFHQALTIKMHLPLLELQAA